MRTRRNTPFFVAALTAVALVGGSAFTASNTGISDHVAGVGQTAVSGITIDAMDYQLSNDRTNVVSVDFESLDEGFDDTTQTAQLQLTSGGVWYDCNMTTSTDTATAPHTIVCDDGGTNIDAAFSSVDQLTLHVETDDATA